MWKDEELDTADLFFETHFHVSQTERYFKRNSLAVKIQAIRI